MWNAIYVKLVNLLSNISVIPADILTQVCGYFALVGEKSEETEIEIAFRHEIIYNHLVPATNVLTVFTELIPDQKQQVSTTSTLTPATILYQVYKSSGCTDAPWAALSSFPPFDFFTCLPESPKVLVQQLAVSLEESVSESRKLTLNTLESFLHAGSIDAHAFPGQCRILASLITNEIKWMRRAVFKGLAADSGAVFLRQPRSLNRGVGDSDGQDVMMARKPLLDLIVKIVVDAVASLSGGGGGGGGGKTTSRSGAAGLGGGAVVPVKLLSSKFTLLYLFI